MTAPSIAADTAASDANPGLAYAISGERQGRWRLDSFFDDRDLAVFEAQQLTRRRHYRAVKVELRAGGDGGAPTTIFQSGGATAAEVTPLRRPHGRRRRSGRAKILTLGALALCAAALALILSGAV